ncbi:MAG: type II secretion system protein N [Pseudomonadota bacterium]
MEKLLNAMPLITGTLLALVIAALMGWQGLQLSQRLSESPEQVADRQAESGNGTDADNQPPELEELTFFGTPGEEPSESVERAETLPETNLQLLLRGVMAGDAEQRDSALVEGPDGETDVYSVGDSLPGNASLREVRKRRIVIEREGALETLTFPENKEAGQLAVRDNQDSDNSDADAATGSEPAAASGDDVRDRLNDLRDRLSN